MLENDVCIREMFALEREISVLENDVCIRLREMSVLEREMSVSEWRLYYTGICTREISV